MYAYLTNKASRQPFPKGWKSMFNDIIIYDRELTEAEINANMFTKVPLPWDSEDVANVYDRLSKIESMDLLQLLGGIDK